MKSLVKKILVVILGWQVRRLRRRNNFKIIGVAGSIGKTSTKLAIAKVLESAKKVRYQEGNYNEITSVPLIFFGHAMPRLWNAFAWLKIIFSNEIQIVFKYPYEVVVVELGTDAPGQISQFRKYLHLDIAVVTAIAYEHMEFFGSLEEVADEEWSVSHFSGIVFANRDLCSVAPENLDNRKVVYYGKELSAYKIENISATRSGLSFDISHEGKKIMSVDYPAVSEVQLYSICAAVAVARALKIPDDNIRKAIGGIKSFSGRMQKLEGVKNSIILDDTYNSSPSALKMALDTLYNYNAPQRIAVLGMMNELGSVSEEEHRKAGKYCDPKYLDWVVTIGKDANVFLAPSAQNSGCRVYRAKDSADAGRFVREKVKDGAVILLKGSQNGVFAEEAIKPLLKNDSDLSKLVRQSNDWLKKKGLL